MDWLASMHALLNHLPVAIGLLLPWPMLAAQRPGRGMRPWWTVSRYLATAGVVGLLLNLLSGPLLARHLGLPWAHRVPLRALLGVGPETLVLRHALLALASLGLGLAALWFMTRPRRDHENLGNRSLVSALAWCVFLIVTGLNGHALVELRRGLTPVADAAPRPLPASAPPPSADLSLLRVLDYGALEPMHPQPVKSAAHGNRWVRAWASPEAISAYREGTALPPGAWVVLSTQEDHRGGAALGPLYALEMTATGPSLAFYWGVIPEARRQDFGGASKVFWRGREGRLDSCLPCHATGLADPTTRSHFRLRREASPE
jgi:hypothetical protein